MITGRICAHPCQDGCNRNQTDESVAINSVERTLGDYIMDNADRFYAPPEKETGKSVAIVGSGPGRPVRGVLPAQGGQQGHGLRQSKRRPAAC